MIKIVNEETVIELAAYRTLAYRKTGKHAHEPCQFYYEFGNLLPNYTRTGVTLRIPHANGITARAVAWIGFGATSRNENLRTSGKASVVISCLLTVEAGNEVGIDIAGRDRTGFASPNPLTFVR